MALSGFKAEADASCGINKVTWFRDVQLRWVLVKTRHGARQMTRLHWA
jgi:hypothetical protein